MYYFHVSSVVWYTLDTKVCAFITHTCSPAYSVMRMQDHYFLLLHVIAVLIRIQSSIIIINVSVIVFSLTLVFLAFLSNRTQKIPEYNVTTIVHILCTYKMYSMKRLFLCTRYYQSLWYFRCLISRDTRYV